MNFIIHRLGQISCQFAPIFTNSLIPNCPVSWYTVPNAFSRGCGGQPPSYLAITGGITAKRQPHAQRFISLLVLLAPLLPIISLVQWVSSHAAAESILSDSHLFLPLIRNTGEQTASMLDGVALEISTPFLPGEFESSEIEDANQIATAFSLNPFQSFSIISVPYGPPPPIEELPDAEPGGAEIYRNAPANYRIQQGGTPMPTPAVTLFGQSVIGNYSIVELITGRSLKKLSKS